MRSIGVMGAVAAAALAVGAPAFAGQRVARVVDGDTIVLASGQRVRLVQIDAPETHGTLECHGTQSAEALTRLLPAGAAIRLVRDPRLDDRDRYGRLLRYVFKGKLNVNLRLVARGDATVWFFDGDRGRYAGKLLSAQQHARARRLGLWQSCPGTRVDPLSAATTGPVARAAQPKPKPTAGGACEAGYTPCLPAGPDLDCGQIAAALKPIHVSGADPFRLDSDGDGVACER